MRIFRKDLEGGAPNRRPHGPSTGKATAGGDPVAAGPPPG